MKNKILNLILFTTCFIMTNPIIVFCTTNEELVIRNISNTFLRIFSWFAYAIGIGALIFFGIKYVMSGANQKANLKGMIPNYLIGVAVIVLCFTIASYLANLAGNDTAEEIINVGESAGDHFN